MQHPVAETVEMDPRDLQHHPRNWRLHPERQKKALRANLERFGFLEGIIWNQTTQTLIDGHARVEEAIQLDLPTVPVVVVHLGQAGELSLLAECDRLGEIATVNEYAQLDLLKERIDELGCPPPAYVGDELLARLQPLDLSGPQSEPHLEPHPEKPDDGWRQITLLFTPEEYQEYLQLVEGEMERSETTYQSSALLALLESAL